MKTAYTKKQAIEYKDSGIKFEYDKNLLNTIYKFHVDIGASKELPTDKRTLQNYLIRLHETITVNNPIYPDHVEFDRIYPSWMMAVIYEEAKRNGNNISALARCFNEWYKVNADKYIKSEAPSYGNTKSRRVAEFSNAEIARQYDIILMLNENNLNTGLFGSTGAKSYFNRVKQEYEARFGK